MQSLLKLIPLLLLCLYGLRPRCQQTLSPSQLQEDYSIFVCALREAHPGLYRYTSKESMDSLFRITGQQLQTPRTTESFYQLLAPVVASIRCGHTKWHREGRPDDPFPFRQQGLLPVRLYFEGDRAFVRSAYTAQTAPAPGTEILRINGRTTQSLLQQLGRVVPVDGHVNSAFYDEMNRNFSGYYASFIGTSGQFSFEFRQGSKIRTMVLPSVDLAAIQKWELQSKRTAEKSFRLRLADKNTAVMNITQFFARPGDPDYHRFLDSSFQFLKSNNISSLILDLRNNEGGIEEWGGLLYSYLADGPFTYYDKIRVAQKEEFSFRKYAWLPEQYDGARSLIVEKDGAFYWTHQEYLKPKEPQPNAFKGQVFLLLNGTSFSVTTEFSAVVRDHTNAIIMGQESGGAYEGDNSGVFTSVTLPNSKLTVGIPLFGFYMKVSEREKGRGILPHHTIPTSINDILTGRDPVMEAALKLASKKQDRLSTR